jgi:hypothetical protein
VKTIGDARPRGANECHGMRMSARGGKQGGRCRVVDVRGKDKSDKNKGVYKLRGSEILLSLGVDRRCT